MTLSAVRAFKVLRFGVIKSLFVLLLFFSVVAHAQSQSVKLKAVFLFKFFDYASWTDSKNPPTTSRGILCTYGPHPFGNTLDYIARKKSNGVAYQVRSISTAAEAEKCNIVYVGSSRVSAIKTLLRSHALIVSDHRGAIRDGSVVEISEQDEKIKLTVHMGHAEAQDVRISSRLLKIAEVIK